MAFPLTACRRLTEMLWLRHHPRASGGSGFFAKTGPVCAGIFAQ
jgi:hypothetical protein